LLTAAQTKESILNRSLSVIWRVHNAQAWLSERAAQILDVVAELTDRFEILIVDDGSTDSTCDMARDLVRRYPQVRLLHEPVKLGASQTIRRGLHESRGDVVLAHDGESVPDAQEVMRLWRASQSPMPAPKSLRYSSKPMSHNRHSRSDTRTSGGGFQLLRPSASGSLRMSRQAVNESHLVAPR
jgi:hypothetical protein